MAEQKRSKQEMIVQLVQVFRQYGYEGASLTRISQATGLTRASLYHHFPNGKEEMAAAVLSHLNCWLEENIITPLRGDSRLIERLHAMSKKVDDLYHYGQQSCLLAVLSLGEAHDLFHAQISNALKLWIDTLAQVLVESGISPELAQTRAEDAIVQIQGSLVLARALNDTTSFQRILQRLPEILLST